MRPGDFGPVGAGNPEDVIGAAGAGEAAGDEKMVGEAVQIFHRRFANLIAARQFDREPLCAAADRAGEVKMRRRRCPAGQHEAVEWREIGVHLVDLGFEPLHLAIDNAQRREFGRRLFGRREVGAEIEEVVLDAREHAVQLADRGERRTGVLAAVELADDGQVRAG